MWLFNLFLIYYRIAGAGLVLLAMLFAAGAIALTDARKTALTWAAIGLAGVAAFICGVAGFSLLFTGIGQ